MEKDFNKTIKPFHDIKSLLLDTYCLELLKVELNLFKHKVKYKEMYLILLLRKSPPTSLMCMHKLFLLLHYVRHHGGELAQW